MTRVKMNLLPKSFTKKKKIPQVRQTLKISRNVKQELTRTSWNFKFTSHSQKYMQRCRKAPKSKVKKKLVTSMVWIDQGINGDDLSKIHHLPEKVSYQVTLTQKLKSRSKRGRRRKDSRRSKRILYRKIYHQWSQKLSQRRSHRQDSFQSCKLEEVKS